MAVKKQSAGILIYKRVGKVAQVFLVHPDGPFWGKKDFWTIPKGELKDGEDFLVAARREFKEELGFEPPAGEYMELGSSKQSGGKTDFVWTIEGDADPRHFNCTSLVSMEWPPHSGKIVEFPEVDKAEWMDISKARAKVFKNQKVFLERLAEKLGLKLDEPEPEVEQASLF